MQLTTDQTVVLVCEKKSQYDLTLEAFQAEFPDLRFYGIVTHSSGPHTFGQKLPRNMPISAVPRISDPVWDVKNQRVWLDDELQECMDAQALLRRSDVIICATDADREGAHAFRNLTRHYLDDPDDQRDFPLILPVALDPKTIRDEIRTNRSTADGGYQKAVARGDAKRFFDYNWAINAIPLFAPLLAKVGVPQESRWMSKYALQLLIELRRLNRKMTEGDLIKVMHTWKGTGKHTLPYSEFGSPASRATIVEQLIGMGFLMRVNPEDRPARYVVSELGVQFLDMLHPRCRDVDLHFRIHAWGTDWPASRPAVETYIRTFFGRQRRYSAKR
ncbi:hypothetical protein KUV57_11115 [Epibacterium sp. DP7N7-1]|nr:hypothetical protein [Epibacterium sp. DP7N7-1]